MSHALYSVLLGVYVLVALLLIAAVGSQTSRDEGGLTGMLGGKVEAAPFIRKKTWEDHLNRITSVLAWGFLLLSTVIVIYFQNSP